MGAQLRLVGLRVKEVAADGNCFFRSLADQTEASLHEGQQHRHCPTGIWRRWVLLLCAAAQGDGGDHLALRGRIVSHVTSQREEFEPFIEVSCFSGSVLFTYPICLLQTCDEHFDLYVNRKGYADVCVAGSLLTVRVPPAG